MTAAGRTFLAGQEGWTELGYADQNFQLVTPQSAVWLEITRADPSLGALAALDRPVLFQIQGQWYHLTPDDRESEPR
jgi:hypothetical protein